MWPIKFRTLAIHDGNDSGFHVNLSNRVILRISNEHFSIARNGDPFGAIELRVRRGSAVACVSGQASAGNVMQFAVTQIKLPQ